ncbi:MAG: FAD-binding dehydrogenase [Deinococcales bacterium]
MTPDADVIVVGAGLAGLVAAAEAADAGRRVLLLDQESEANLGGQAFWSFGGLFLVDTPQQRRLGIRDSVELAWRDWLATAAFDRDDDRWPRRWAEAYVAFAAGEKRAWLRAHGIGFFPIVGWAERGMGRADGPGNSVPRFHIAWGTGPALVEAFARRVREHERAGRLELRFRHRVRELEVSGGAVRGVVGDVLEPDDTERGRPTSRAVAGSFRLAADAVVVASGGIGGDHDLVRRNWPAERLGAPPGEMLTGVPAHVDGRLQQIVAAAGGRLIHADRMWHYTEGVRNHDPLWPGHGIRILPGPSSLWLDPDGRRLPPPYLPGFNTLDTLQHLGRRGHAYTWFVLDRRILRREFALSGSEQNPDLTGRSLNRLVRGRLAGLQPPLRAFLERGEDFVQATTLDRLIRSMNALTGEDRLDPDVVRAEVEARDEQLVTGFGKDFQAMAIRNARRSLGDRLIRVARPHRLLDPAAGPLVAARLRVLTRKTLGGLETDLQGRVLRLGGDPFPGLFAAGEVAGFGGGGMHGYRSLEGTFLGGCLFSGRIAGRAAAGVAV